VAYLPTWFPKIPLQALVVGVAGLKRASNSRQVFQQFAKFIVTYSHITLDNLYRRVTPRINSAGNSLVIQPCRQSVHQETSNFSSACADRSALISLTKTRAKMMVAVPLTIDNISHCHMGLVVAVTVAYRR
jgi:hypothetical protein